MQTTIITITEEAYQARQDALDALTTRALRKERTAIAWEVAVAERQASGEDHFSLTCLLEWVDGLIEGRRNGYTGAYEN